MCSLFFNILNLNKAGENNLSSYKYFNQLIAMNMKKSAN